MAKIYLLPFSFIFVFKVFMIVYVNSIHFILETRSSVILFVRSLSKLHELHIHAEMLQKPKVHLLLHMADNMADFRPTSAYNTERYNVYCFNTNNIMYICPILQTDANPSIHFYILSMFLGTNSHQADRDIAWCMFCCSRAYTLWWNTRW